MLQMRSGEVRGQSSFRVTPAARSQAIGEHVRVLPFGIWVGASDGVTQEYSITPELLFFFSTFLLRGQQ